MRMARRAHLPRWVPDRPTSKRDPNWLRTDATRASGNWPGRASSHRPRVTAQWKLGLYVIAPTSDPSSQESGCRNVSTGGKGEGPIPGTPRCSPPRPSELPTRLLLRRPKQEPRTHACWAPECPGWDSNPHVPFGTSAFKAHPSASSGTRAKGRLPPYPLSRIVTFSM